MAAHMHSYRVYPQRPLLRAGVILLCCFVLAACGKKDFPSPPQSIGPDSVKKLMAIARSGGIMLAWKPPTKNTDKSPLLDLESFKIYREEVAWADRCKKCPKNFRLLFDYAYTGTRGTVPERELFFYTDSAIKPGYVYSYKIECLNERDMLGASSETVTLFWDVPPSPPSMLRAERKGRTLDLSWERPLTLEDGKPLEAPVHFNIYRSQEKGIYKFPLNPAPITEAAYQDTPDTYDKTYYYVVRAVRQVSDNTVESAPSEELPFLYEDIIPPGPPQGLTAIPDRRGMILKWIAKSEPGVAGFNVYRRNAGAGAFARINRELIQENSWLDASARIGTRYEYAVTAVDQSLRKNESELSAPIAILHLPQ
jgi:fibronectin type 3 domain-containing protein